MAIPDSDTDNITPAEYERLVARAQHCGWLLTRSRIGFTLRGPSGAKHMMDAADVARELADLKRGQKRTQPTLQAGQVQHSVTVTFV